jgi:hypothetical protein
MIRLPRPLLLQPLPALLLGLVPPWVHRQAGLPPHGLLHWLLQPLRPPLRLQLVWLKRRWVVVRLNFQPLRF